MSQSSLAIRLQHSVKPQTISFPIHKTKAANQLWEEKWLRSLLMAFLSALGYHASQAILKRQNNMITVSVMVAPKNLLLSSKRRYPRIPLLKKPWNPNYWKRYQAFHQKLLLERLSLFKSLWNTWWGTELVFNLTCTRNITLSTSLLSQVMRENLLDSSLRSKYRRRLKATRVLAIYMRRYKALIPWYALPRSWSFYYEEWNSQYAHFMENILIVFIWKYFFRAILQKNSNLASSLNTTQWSLYNPISSFTSPAWINQKRWNNYGFRSLPAPLYYWLSIAHIMKQHSLQDSLQFLYPYLIQIMRSIFWQNVQNQGISITITGQLHRHVRTARFKRKVGFFSFNSANTPSQHTHFHVRTKYGIWGFHVDAT